MISKIFFLYGGLFLALGSVSAQDNPNNASAQPVLSESEKLALNASGPLMQTEAFKLLIYTSVLSTKVGEVVEVSPAIQAKYNTIRNSVFASLPMTVVAGATYWSSGRSADEFQSVLAPITAAVRWVMLRIVDSANQVWKISERLRIDQLLEQSGRSFNASIEAIEPLLKIFISKGFGISVLTVSGSATLGASSFLIWNSRAEDALDYTAARKLLGYNRDVKANIDASVSDLATIFSLSAKEEAQFKDALFDEIMKQAVAQKFDRHASFSVDAVKLLSSKNIISPEQAGAANALREITAIATSRRIDKSSDQKTLIQNIDTVVALCAVLEAYIEKANLSENDEKEVRQLLGNAQRNLKIVRLNFKG